MEVLSLQMRCPILTVCPFDYSDINFDIPVLSVTVFWALRGGGAGSWGVIISATFRTFATFDVVQHSALIVANSSAAIGQLATLHAQHIFDWDDLHVGQYFFVNGSASSFTWFLTSYFPNGSVSAANASMAPFLDAVTMTPGLNVVGVLTNLSNVNDALSPSSNDGGGTNSIMGSRLIPADVYRYNTSAIGEVYQALFDAGTPGWVISFLDNESTSDLLETTEY